MAGPMKKVSGDRGDGLSPSSMSLFMSCARKYWHKVNDTPYDKDYEDESEALQVGKAFHKVLEDCKHELSGISFSSVMKTCTEFFEDAEKFAPMIFVMLSKYKIVHERAGLKAFACEVNINTPDFYGFVDVILTGKNEEWWIGDMKTASGLADGLALTLPGHPQLNLYAAHKDLLASTLKLDPQKFMGCRYRLTTKSRLIKNAKEDNQAFLARLAKSSIRSFDFIIPARNLKVKAVSSLHQSIRKLTKDAKGSDQENYPPNFSNCTQYYRPCSYYSQCYGCLYSDGEVEMVQSE
jgi:hypothetical protein